MKQDITNIEELNKFIKSNTIIAKYAQIQFLFFSKEDNKKYSEKINKYRNACGCKTGTYFLVVSFVLCIIAAFFKFSAFNTSLIKQFLIAFGILVIFSLIGKGMGLLYAKFKLRLLIRNVKKRYYNSASLSKVS